MLGFVPLAMFPNYCATKAAVPSFTVSLRHQLKQIGIQVLEPIPPYVKPISAAEAVRIRGHAGGRLHLLSYKPAQEEP